MQTSGEDPPAQAPDPGTAAGGLNGAGSPVADRFPAGGDSPPRALARTTASGSSSSSSSVSTVLAVLFLLGLIAPRLSRWLRPRPVIWRPYALAEALELPG